MIIQIFLKVAIANTSQCDVADKLYEKIICIRLNDLIRLIWSISFCKLNGFLKSVHSKMEHDLW